MNSKLQTGYEVYDKDNNLDTHASHAYMRDFIIARSPEKYESFLKKMKKIEAFLKIRQVPDYKVRSQLIENIYNIMRMIDDIVDGDGPMVLGTVARRTYLHRVISYITSFRPGVNTIKYDDLVKNDLATIFHTAYSIGIFSEVQEGIIQIMRSFLFDAERINETKELKEKGTGIIAKRTGKELWENFHLCDVDGCIQPTAIIMGIEWKKAVKVLRSLGLAMRDVYTLQDIFEDPRLGLCNISIEELEKFAISDKDLVCLESNTENNYAKIPLSIQSWMHSVVQRTKDHLLEYHENMQVNTLDITYQTQVAGLNTTAMMQKISDLLFENVLFPKAYLSEALEVIAKLERIYNWSKNEKVAYLSF